MAVMVVLQVLPRQDLLAALRVAQAARAIMAHRTRLLRREPPQVVAVAVQDKQALLVALAVLARC
jgi:hypothetical protein